MDELSRLKLLLVRYKDHTDEQLIAIRHQKIPSCDEHIQVVQVLYARQQQRQEEAATESRTQHQTALAQERGLRRETRHLTWIAIAVSILAAVFGFLAFVRDWQPQLFSTAATSTPYPTATPAPETPLQPAPEASAKTPDSSPTPPTEPQPPPTPTDQKP